MTKNGKNGNGGKALAGTFVVDMPLDGPPLGFDPSSETFSWMDILPANYWNLDLLEAKQQLLGGNPVLTPARIIIKPVVDPELPEAAQDKSPKVVLEFQESAPALVFNKTRCILATKFTGTPDPRQWARLLPPLELYAGAYRDMADSLQVLFRPVDAKPANGNGNSRAKSNSQRLSDPEQDRLNEELFG